MSDSLLGSLVGYGVLLLLSVIIARAIFSIGTIVRHLKIQSDLLALIANKQGVSEEHVNSILNKR